MGKLSFISCILLVTVESKIYLNNGEVNGINDLMNVQRVSPAVTLWDVCQSTFLKRHPFVTVVSVGNNLLDGTLVS